MDRHPLILTLLGNLPDAEMDLFAPADDSIGTVWYSYTNCKVGEKAPPKIKVILTGMVGAVIGVIIGLIIIKLNERVDTIWYIMLLTFLAGLGFFFSKAQFRKFICYVGTEGIQWMETLKTRNNIYSKELFLFKKSSHLVKELETKTSNGSYDGTNFTYKWVHYEYGKEIVDYQGWGYFYASKEGVVSLEKYPKFHFCKRAEELWTEYIFTEASVLLRRNGFLDFHSKWGGYIRLSNDYIEIHSRDEKHHQRISGIDEIKCLHYSELKISAKCYIGSSASSNKITTVNLQGYYNDLLLRKLLKLLYKFSYSHQ